MNRMLIVALLAIALAMSACTASGQPSAGEASPPAAGGSTPIQSADSGGGGQSGGGTKPDPCTLLTPIDLKAEFGLEFQPGNLVGTTAAPHVECEWAKQGGFSAWLTLAIDDIGSSGWGCLGNAEPVPGVGNEACFGDVGLHVRRGSWDLVFSGCDQCIAHDQLLDIAKLAVSHL